MFGVAGDWHGREEAAEAALTTAAANNLKTVFQVGDFGGEDLTGFIRYVSKLATTLSIVVKFIPGNHERYDLLPAGTEPVELAPNVVYIPKGATVQEGEFTLLGFGGAISIDWQHRIGNGLYWDAREEITDADVQVALTKSADIVLTHDAPLYVLDEDGVLASPDQSLTGDKIRRTRKKISEVLDAVKPKLVLHGHHHFRYSSKHVSYEHSCPVEGLGMEREYGSLVSVNDKLEVVNIPVK